MELVKLRQHQIITRIWHGEKVPERWLKAVIKVSNKTKDRTECGNYRGISLVAHAGKALPRVVATTFDDYFKTKGLPPEEQCGFRLRLSTLYMMSKTRRLQNIYEKHACRCSCASPTSKRHTIPSITPIFGRYSLASDCHHG